MFVSRLNLSKQLSALAQSDLKRQKLIATRFTAVGGLLLLGATLFSYLLYAELKPITIILGLYTFAFWATLVVIIRSFRMGIFLINAIAFTLLSYLFASGGHEGTGLFWTYPVLLVFLFINNFKTACWFGAAYLCSMLVFITLSYFENTQPSTIFKYDTNTLIRYLVTIISLSIAALINSFFQTRADNYIKDMYANDMDRLLNHDAMTGLANRAAFTAYFEQYITQESPSHVSALVYIDIDDFKHINDTYGHHTGDRVLNEFAKQIVSWANQNGEPHQLSLSRFGGDEFVCLIPSIRSKAKFESSLESLKGSLTKGENTLSTSIGAIYFTPNPKIKLNELLVNADRNMYEKKHSGKNGHIITSHE